MTMASTTSRAHPGQVIRFRPRQAAAIELRRWRAACEQIAASNLRLACAWQRLAIRLLWGL